MRFFSVAAVFLAGAASVFADDVEKRGKFTESAPQKEMLMITSR